MKLHTVARNAAELKRLYGESARILRQDPALLTTPVPAVSGWSILNHLAHIALANRWILAQIVLMLGGKEDFDVRGGPRPLGRLMLVTGYIPRGVAEAPRVAQPPDETRSDRVEAWLDRQRPKVDLIHSESEAVESLRYRFRHPYLGPLVPRQWVRFMAVHTRHHLKIVSDILGHPNSPPRTRGPVFMTQ